MSMTLDRHTYGDRAYWQINVDGQRLDSFNRKREAVRMFEALRPYEKQYQRLAALDRDRSVEGIKAAREERRMLVPVLNDAYLAAKRNIT